MTSDTQAFEKWWQASHLSPVPDHILRLYQTRPDYRDHWDRKAGLPIPRVAGKATPGKRKASSGCSGCGKIAEPTYQIPGKELRFLLQSLGFKIDGRCKCLEYIEAMDSNGLAWCEQNVETIAGWLREGAPKFGWTDWVKAAALSIPAGIAFKLDPFDPFPGLVIEALRRCAAREPKPSRRPKGREQITITPRPAVPFTGPITRHMLFHVLPTNNGVWQRFAPLLEARLPLFNGKKIVAICTGAAADKTPLASPEAVRAAYSWADSFVEVENNPKRREVATFEPLFSRVESIDPNACVFYGHTKGATKPVNDGVTVHRWGDMMLESCLDYWPLVERMLQQYHTVGSFKKLGAFFGGTCGWHYSGTFFWMRSHQIFSREWRNIHSTWWGMEAWPAKHFASEEAGTLFYERAGFDMYRMNTLLPAWEEFKEWKRVNEPLRTR